MLEKRSAHDVDLPSTHNSRPSNGRSSFFDRVVVVVSQIPHGRVTTYGTIARALGAPRAAREVGWALSGAPGATDVPCHRVVNGQGFLSGGWHWGHPDIMAGLLRDEGVPFLEQHRVDLAACLWIPENEMLNQIDAEGPSTGPGAAAANARSSPG